MISLETTQPALKILLVDDDRMTRLHLKNLVCKAGHRVVEAANGLEGVSAFENEAPDLILMDVSMPVMTGYEAATLIKQQASERFVPIIFLTAHSDDESLAQCVVSGGDDFLAKPVNKVLLNAKITAMLRISRMNRELEVYKRRTEEEIELSHHVFDSLTRRMSDNIISEITNWQRSAGHFNGDLMIYDKSPSGKLYLLLGDFTGHGLSAAIGALPTSDVFFAMTRRDFDAASILAEINRKLREIMPISHFCASGFICYDAETDLIEIFNGGLPPIIVLDANRKIVSHINSRNVPLGILSAGSFQPEITTLTKKIGYTLILYSDGVTEARNSDGQMFGEDRLNAALQSADAPYSAIKTALEHYIGSQPLEDDVSLVTISL